MLHIIFFVLLCIFSLTFSIPSIIHASSPGLSFDQCSPNSSCVSPRQCLDDNEQNCPNGFSICRCYPPKIQFCVASSDCIPGEVCVQTSEDFSTICASQDVEKSVSSISIASAPSPLPEIGLLYDDCKPGISDCKEGLACSSTISRQAPCDANGRCICTSRNPQFCFQDSNCDEETVCAVESTFRIPTCVSKTAEGRWDSLQRVNFQLPKGLTLDPCAIDSECKGNRMCFSPSGQGTPCRGNEPCFCLTPALQICENSNDCDDEMEACVELLEIFALRICASIQARDTFNFVIPHSSEDVCPILFDEDRPEDPAKNFLRQFISQNRNTERNAEITNLSYLYRPSTISNALRVLGGPVAQPAIVGGLRASPRLSKYLVGVFSDRGTCTGVLVSERWILTAAHCSVKKGDRVVFGRMNLNSDGAAGVVAMAFTHPNAALGSVPVVYDLSALQLEQDAPSGSKFMAVNIVHSIPEPGDSVRIIGYGKTGIDKRSDGLLRQVDLKIISYQDCNNLSLPGRTDIPVAKSLFLCAAVIKEKCSSW